MLVNIKIFLSCMLFVSGAISSQLESQHKAVKIGEAEGELVAQSPDGTRFVYRVPSKPYTQRPWSGYHNYFFTNLNGNQIPMGPAVSMPTSWGESIYSVHDISLIPTESLCVLREYKFDGNYKELYRKTYPRKSYENDGCKIDVKLITNTSLIFVDRADSEFNEFNEVNLITLANLQLHFLGRIAKKDYTSEGFDLALLKNGEYLAFWSAASSSSMTKIFDLTNFSLVSEIHARVVRPPRYLSEFNSYYEFAEKKPHSEDFFLAYSHDSILEYKLNDLKHPKTITNLKRGLYGLIDEQSRYLLFGGAEILRFVDRLDLTKKMEVPHYAYNSLLRVISSGAKVIYSYYPLNPKPGTMGYEIKDATFNFNSRKPFNICKDMGVLDLYTLFSGNSLFTIRHLNNDDFLKKDDFQVLTECDLRTQKQKDIFHFGIDRKNKISRIAWLKKGEVIQIEVERMKSEDSPEGRDRTFIYKVKEQKLSEIKTSGKLLTIRTFYVPETIIYPFYWNSKFDRIVGTIDGQGIYSIPVE